LFLARGVVCGMEYLHSIRPHPVIHGDLKIQNILVGDGLVAKVCVFVYFVYNSISVCWYLWFKVVGWVTTSSLFLGPSLICSTFGKIGRLYKYEK